MLLAFWAGLIPAAALSMPVLNTLVRLKSRQTVSQYAPEGHQVKQGTPTMGGLIIVLGVLVAAFMTPGHSMGETLILLLGFAAIGFLDDFVVPRLTGKRGLGWKQKIAMQLLAAGGAGMLAYGPLNWERLFLYVFLVLFFSNAYNFSDGLDGLAGSLGILFFVGVAGIVLAVGYASGAGIIAMAIVGATIPFLFLNAPPAKVFMGDVGSLPIGALMGGMIYALLLPVGKAGMFDPASEWFNGRALEVSGFLGMNVVPVVVVALLVLSLMMVAELVPVPMQVASVKLFKRRIFPYTPIHHAFEKAGWPETRVVARFVLVQLILSALAITIAVTAAGQPVNHEPRFRPVVSPS